MLLYACLGVIPCVIAACIAATRAASPAPMLEARTRCGPPPMLLRCRNEFAACQQAAGDLEIRYEHKCRRRVQQLGAAGCPKTLKSVLCSYRCYMNASKSASNHDYDPAITATTTFSMLHRRRT